MVPWFTSSASSLSCSMRRAIPYPWRGPIASRVFKTIRSSVPCRISDLVSAIRSEIPTLHVGCQEEREDGQTRRSVPRLLGGLARRIFVERGDQLGSAGRRLRAAVEDLLVLPALAVHALVLVVVMGQ